MTDALDPRRHAVADRVLDQESAARRHLVVALSGAHAYGFPSPDSDLDLKAIHVSPTEEILGLWPPPPSAPDRLEVVDGLEVDYSSNEIQPVLVGILQGNGNFIERVLSRFLLRTFPGFPPLRGLVSRSLSRRVHRHYRGFATGQLREWEKDGFRSAKKLLYVLRDAHGFGAARELVDAKRRGERAELTSIAERWRGEVARAFEVLDGALARSILPEEPPNVREVEAWLVRLRREGMPGKS